jgi:plastocyanin
MRGLLVLVAAVTLSACGGGAQAAATARVDIKAFDFQPDPLTIKRGTTVRFVNHDEIHHTATAGMRSKPRPSVFDVKLAATGTGRFTFRKAGTYRYFCTFHPGPGMVGKIVVR